MHPFDAKSVTLESGGGELRLRIQFNVVKVYGQCLIRGRHACLIYAMLSIFTVSAFRSDTRFSCVPVVTRMARVWNLA